MSDTIDQTQAVADDLYRGADALIIELEPIPIVINSAEPKPVTTKYKTFHRLKILIPKLAAAATGILIGVLLAYALVQLP